MLLSRRFWDLCGAALVVGALAGLAGVAFRYAINAVEVYAFGQGFLDLGEGQLPGITARETNEYIQSPWGYAVVLVPLVGGAIVGMLRRIWPATRQRGIAEVMAAVQAKGGVLHARTSWGHAILSAITVGTGGSTGREGPIAYIGASIGSSLSRRWNFRPRDIKILVGCGFASGVGATFNAPLGAVLLALELVVPEFSTHAFIPLALSAVAGVALGRAFLGDEATFDVGEFHMATSWELLMFLALGAICGLASVAFIRLMVWTHQVWTEFRLPEEAKPALGGLLVGMLGLGMFLLFKQYHVFGTGYATVTRLLEGSSLMPGGSAIMVLLVLVFVKPLATSITIGSGGGGGVFSASLYQGALVGAIVGLLAQFLAPDIGISPGAYALVGMGAFYAATARATLTAIVMIAELTNDFTVVLPIMFSAVAADAVSIALSRDSIYTVSLTRQGIRYEHARLQSPLDILQVKDVMSKRVNSLPATTRVFDAFVMMLDGGHTGYPVTDAEGKLAGIVTRRDLSRIMQEDKGDTPLSAVVTGLTVTAFPDEMLHRARDRMHAQDIGRLVVVDPQDRRTILGILTRSDILHAESKGDEETREPGTANP